MKRMYCVIGHEQERLSQLLCELGLTVVDDVVDANFVLVSYSSNVLKDLNHEDLISAAAELGKKVTVIDSLRTAGEHTDGVTWYPTVEAFEKSMRKEFARMAAVKAVLA